MNYSKSLTRPIVGANRKAFHRAKTLLFTSTGIHKIKKPRNPIDTSNELNAACSTFSEAFLQELRTASNLDYLDWILGLRQIPDDYYRLGAEPVLGQFNPAPYRSYDRLMAEKLARRISPGSAEDWQPQIPVGDSWEPYLLLIQSTILLEHLRSIQRRSEKGARISFPAWDLPRYSNNDPVNKSISAFDKRVESEFIPFWNAGSIFVSRKDSPHRFSYCVPLSGQKDGLERYIIRNEGVTPLAEFSRRLEKAGLIMANARSLASLLLLSEFLCSVSEFRAPIEAHGLIAVSKADMREFENAFGSNLWRYLQSILPNLPDTMCLDEAIASIQTIQDNSKAAPFVLTNSKKRAVFNPPATYQLVEDLLTAIATTGQEANLLADHFEDHVQWVVDESEWAPPVEFKDKYKGLIVKKKNGELLTDLDCVACKRDHLIIISCKGAKSPHTDHDGANRRFRNLSTMLSNSAQQWAEVVAYIDHNRVGLGYDFSTFSKITGVIVTPRPIWVHPDQRGAELPTDCISWNECQDYFSSVK